MEIKNINGYEAKYVIKDVNAKYTVVCVHGYNASSDSFIKMMDFKSNYNIIAINLPGNNYYEDDKVNSIEEMGEFVNNFIKEIKGPIIILGHSMGGAIISHIKNRFKIKRYIFVSALNPTASESKLHSVAQKLSSNNVSRGIVSGLLNTLGNKRMKEVNTFIKPPEWLKDVHEKVIFNKDFIENNLKDKYLRITKPVTAIIGDQDPFIPPIPYVNFFQEYFNVEPLVVKAAHSPLIENPGPIEEYLNEIIPFKKRLFRKTIIKK